MVECEEKLIIKKVKYIKLNKLFSAYEAEHNKEYLYYCDKCGYYIEYKKQREIAKEQKNNNSKKLLNSKELISSKKVDLSKIGENIIKDFKL